MNIMLIKANQALYASKGVLNDALFQMSCNILGEHHQIQVTDTATGLWDVDDEIHKLKRADAIVYHFPLWWFGLPHLLKKYFDEVLVYGKTYRIADVYGEGGQLTGKSFMIAVTTNVKKSDLGTVPMLERFRSVDDLLAPLILTHYYVGIKGQLPTFHADDVVRGDTSLVLKNYEAHLKSIDWQSTTPVDGTGDS